MGTEYPEQVRRFDSRKALAREIGATHTATFDGATSGRVHYGRVQGNFMYRTVCRRETAAYEQKPLELGDECGHCRRALDRMIDSAVVTDLMAALEKSLEGKRRG